MFDDDEGSGEKQLLEFANGWLKEMQAAQKASNSTPMMPISCSR